MKRGWTEPVLLILGLAMAGAVVAEEDPGTGTALERWLNARTPGEAHEQLDYFVGDWIATTRAYSGPGEPEVSRGTAHYEWILGGRYLRGSFTGTMTGEGFVGESLEGFDNVSGRYFSLWIDDMGTGYLASHSTDLEPHRRSYHGSYVDPISGLPVQHRMVTEIDHRNRFSLEIFARMEGEPERLVLVTEYERRQLEASN